MKEGEKGGKEALDQARKMLLARALLIPVVAGLLISGLTCYFLPFEVSALLDHVWARSADSIPLLGPEYELLTRMEAGLGLIGREYPEFMLGTDWLGFAHVALAILFAGAVRDPVRNRWVIEFGLISSVLVMPAAFLFGFMRGLPLVHCFIDASFGAVSLVLLGASYLSIRGLGPARA